MGGQTERRAGGNYRYHGQLTKHGAVRSNRQLIKEREGQGHINKRDPATGSDIARGYIRAQRPESGLALIKGITEEL